MWQMIADEMDVPWRTIEEMHWRIGKIGMAQRANVAVFSLAGQDCARTDVPDASPAMRSDAPNSVSSSYEANSATTAPVSTSSTTNLLPSLREMYPEWDAIHTNHLMPPGEYLVVV